MKKLLACLTAGLLVTGASSSVVACSQKAIASLNDKAYLLKTTDNEEGKLDVMRWSNDVLTADTYKIAFIDLYKEHVFMAKDEDPWTKLEVIKGHLTDSPSKDNPTLIAKFLADYQKNSNTGDNTKLVDPIDFDSELTYKIYDENQGDKLVTSFNDKDYVGKWKDDLNDIFLKEEGDVFVIHLKIALETPNSKSFIGARQNIKDKEDIKKYYADLKDENDMPKTENYDYRFDIQFYFSFG